MNNPTSPTATPLVDPMREVFSDKALSRLCRWVRSSPKIIERLNILTAHGPFTSDRCINDDILRWRAQRAAWEAYISAAFACALLEGNRGAELSRRLTGKDEGGFRSAISECMACWFLAGRLGLKVSASAPGKGGSKQPDLGVAYAGDIIGAEVKAPKRDRVAGEDVGLDSGRLEQALEEADRQFSRDIPNVLIINPQLRTSVYHIPQQLISALYGRMVISIPIDTSTGSGIGEGMNFFKSNGLLLRTENSKRRRVTPSGEAKFQSIGAVVIIEERFKYGEPFGSIEHDVLVAHNPNARYPIPEEMWKEIPQLVLRHDRMIWTDGVPLFRPRN